MKLLGSLLLAASLCAPVASGAQGCSQCRESVGQAPERTRQAYQRGIEVLVTAVLCLGGVTFFVARRFR